MLINLANTGVRQPHDYKVLRLWSPAPQLLIPNSYFLTSSVLAYSGAQSEQTAKYHSCHFSLLSIFPIILISLMEQRVDGNGDLISSISCHPHYSVSDL